MLTACRWSEAVSSFLSEAAAAVARRPDQLWETQLAAAESLPALDAQGKEDLVVLFSRVTLLRLLLSCALWHSDLPTAFIPARSNNCYILEGKCCPDSAVV